MGLMEALGAQPPPLSYWLNWMGFVNLLLPLVFVWRHLEARVILVAFIANALFMAFLFEQMGYGKHLGLAHVVFWTPLVFWLAHRFEGARERGGLPLAFYLLVVIATNSASLGLDFVDVIQAFAVRS